MSEDYENSLVRANVLAAMRKALSAPSGVTYAGALLAKGDVEGHEFHGNQYSAAAGEAAQHERNYKAGGTLAEIGHNAHLAAEAHAKASDIARAAGMKDKATMHAAKAGEAGKKSAEAYRNATANEVSSRQESSAPKLGPGGQVLPRISVSEQSRAAGNAARSQHQFSSSIGGDSSNYKR